MSEPRVHPDAVRQAYEYSGLAPTTGEWVGWDDATALSTRRAIVCRIAGMLKPATCGCPLTALYAALALPSKKALDAEHVEPWAVGVLGADYVRGFVTGVDRLGAAVLLQTPDAAAGYADGVCVRDAIAAWVFA